VSAYQIVTATSPSNSTSPKTVIVNCPAGKLALGGGADIGVANADLALQLSGPLAAGAGWQARATETDAVGANWTVSVYAICATVAP
jgi:hypothetical protein